MEKTKQTGPLKFIGIALLIIFIGFIIYMKFLGTYLESNVEKGGYCFLNYGEKYYFTYNEENYACKEKSGNNLIIFSEKEFKDFCPKEKLISSHFFNECFRSAPKDRNYKDIGK